MSISIRPMSAAEVSVYIASSHQGKGLGKQLLQEIVTASERQAFGRCNLVLCRIILQAFDFTQNAAFAWLATVSELEKTAMERGAIPF